MDFPFYKTERDIENERIARDLVIKSNKRDRKREQERKKETDLETEYLKALKLSLNYAVVLTAD